MIHAHCRSRRAFVSVKEWMCVCVRTEKNDRKKEETTEEKSVRVEPGTDSTALKNDRRQELNLANVEVIHRKEEGREGKII